MNSYPVPYRPQGVLARIEQARRAGAVAAIEHAAVVSAAEVCADAAVQRAKLHQVDSLASTAMLGQALLNARRAALARNDPLLDDDVRMFADVARLGKAGVIAAAVDRWTRG